LVFAILVTVILFVFLTPKMMEKYKKMNEDDERSKKMELKK
jgi:type II secretory pathway component PulF